MLLTAIVLIVIHPLLVEKARNLLGVRRDRTACFPAFLQPVLIFLGAFVIYCGSAGAGLLLGLLLAALIAGIAVAIQYAFILLGFIAGVALFFGLFAVFR